MQITRKHILRSLIHLLVWMLFVFVSVYVFSKYYWKINPFFQYLSILIVIVYINHFVVLPFFVKKKWYLPYIGLISVVSFIATKLYCDVFTRCGCSFMKCLSDYLWQTLVPLVFFSFLWLLFRYIDKQDEIEAIKKEHTQMELKLLKSQINPHVLFNNLNTIYSYALEKPKETPDLILKLSNTLKHVLYESNSKTITLNKELAYIDNYIELQQLRVEGTKTIQYTKNIDANNYNVAPLLLITLIENTFKHSNLNSVINIDLKVQNGKLNLQTTNTINKKVRNQNKGIGLKNLEKRLALLYKDKHKLNITKTNSIFKANLELVLD